MRTEHKTHFYPDVLDKRHFTDLNNYELNTKGIFPLIPVNSVGVVYLYT